MVQICPVSDKQINANLSRLNAGFTVLMATAYMVSGSWVFALIMAADFVLRNLFEGRLNPVIKINNYLISFIQINNELINAGPKIFAARVGLALSLLVLGFSIAGFPVAAIVFAGILGLFSFLESVFHICVACILYPYILEIQQKTGRNT